MYGGMPGGPGGMPGGMPNLPPGLMSDPEFMQLVQSPEFQQMMPALMAAQSGDLSQIQQHQDNPILQQMMRIMQRHGMDTGGMGNTGGWGSTSAAPAEPENPYYKKVSSRIQLDPLMGTKNMPVVIYFTMTGCGPCAKFAPDWENICKTYQGRAQFCKVNSRSSDICRLYNVTSFPTAKIFYNREEKAMERGGSMGSTLAVKIERWIATGEADRAPKRRFNYFPVSPQKLPIYRQGKLKAMQKNIIKTNKTLAESPYFCSDAELSLLLVLVKKLENTRIRQRFEPKELGLMDKLLSWEGKNVLGCADLFRLLILQESAAEYYAKNVDTLVKVLELCKSEDQIIPFVALRAVCNMFSHTRLITAFPDLSIVLDAIAPCATATGDKRSEKVRLYYVNVLTILANHFRQNSDEDWNEIKIQILSTVNEVLLKETDKKVLYSTLVCLGTLLLDDDEALSFGSEMFDLPTILRQIVKKCQGEGAEDKANKTTIVELMTMLAEAST